MEARQRQGIALAIGLICAMGALVYIASQTIEQNLVYYWDPQELLAKGDQAKGAAVRLGGVVQQDSIAWDRNTLALSFRVGMQASGPPSILVHATGAPPQMFQAGIGAVVEGLYDGQTFHADRVLVKHSNEYRPPQEGERPKDIYKTLLPEEEGR